MSYKALYRTYRPSTFEAVAGQNHIVRTLENAFKENKIAHAYLFCGPRGTGKTTMARLFAKSLNCEEGFGHQCNNCSNCKAINEGSHPDVIEIDAASNRGIDDIRDLIAKVKYSPTLGKYKVYIIDEVHMMTPEAFNALLKTLEEPPSNVVFILCTTEPYKLMSTILSRVQRYDFNKVSDYDLLANLQMVVDKEGVKASEDALKMIVSLSDGGVRDSLSMLDQALAYSGDHLELHHIQELYGLSTTEEKINLIDALANKDLKFVSSKFEEMINHGTDIKRLTTDLIDVVKDLLIYKTTSDNSLVKKIPLSELNKIDIDKKTLNLILDNLMEAYSQFRYVSNISSLLEIAFLKITSNNDEEETPTKKVESPIKEEVKKIVVQEVKVEPVTKSLIEESVTETVEFKDITPCVEQGEAYVLSEEDTINLMQQGSKMEKQKLIEDWSKINTYLTSPQLGKYASLLRQCTPRIIAQNIIVLETNFNSICNKVNIKENQKGFSKVIELITSTPYIVICLTTQEYLARVKKFSNLRQAGHLPEKYPIQINI